MMRNQPNKLIYLVGVDHSVQHDGRARYEGQEFERIRNNFYCFIKKAVKQNHVRVIAEESNEDVLKKFSATKSIAFVVAAELGLKHIFCEPSYIERDMLGITKSGQPQDFEKRENFWLGKLRKINEMPILFIIGNDHITSFSELANNNGISTKITEAYYGKEYFAPRNKGINGVVRH